MLTKLTKQSPLLFIFTSIILTSITFVISLKTKDLYSLHIKCKSAPRAWSRLSVLVQLKSLHDVKRQLVLASTLSTSPPMRYAVWPPALTSFFAGFLWQSWEVKVNAIKLLLVETRVSVEQVGNERQVQFVVAVDDISRCNETPTSDLVSFVQHTISSFQVIHNLQTSKNEVILALVSECCCCCCYYYYYYLGLRTTRNR